MSDPAQGDARAVVERLYAAAAAGDIAALTATLAPTLNWYEAESGPYADRNPYRGAEAVLVGVLGRIGQSIGDFAATPTAFHADGATVVVEGRYTGVAIATGARLDAQFVHVVAVAHGQIVRFQQYTDTAQWLAVTNGA